MALKSDRNELQTDISFFMNETATRGGVVSISTGGSGAAMDQGAALVTLTAASGKAPIGILLNDVVNLDLTLLGKYLPLLDLGFFPSPFVT